MERCYETTNGAAPCEKTEDLVFAFFPPLPLTLFLIMEFFISVSVNRLLKVVTSTAHFFNLSFPALFPPGIFMSDHNCLICTLVRLIASRRSLGEA